MKSHTGSIYESALCNSVRRMSDKLNELIEKTEEINKEIAFSWCISAPDMDADPYIDTDPLVPYETNYTSNVTNVGNVITGEEIEVTPETIDCGNEVASAAFHTHPGNDIRLSPADYSNSFALGSHVNCIGVKNDDGANTINCDILYPGNDKYVEYGNAIIDMNHAECKKATDEFIHAVENGLPAEQTEAKHEIYMEAYHGMLLIVDAAMSAGVMSRCSLISNLSKVNNN